MNVDKLKRNFEKHGFLTSFFPNSQEATAYLEKKVVGRTVGFGGSISIKEMDLFDTLSKTNTTIWHHRILGDETKDLTRHVKIYITSANGVSETGEIINIDGAGNRIAMTLYGPEKVYYVIGSNKITPDLDSAIFRAKNVAAPKNAKRLCVKTPCALNGDQCYDCISDERICNCMIILNRSPNMIVSEIIFIDEALGY